MLNRKLIAAMTSTKEKREGMEGYSAKGQRFCTGSKRAVHTPDTFAIFGKERVLKKKDG